MAIYRQEEIDSLREQADIVDVISHYVQVHRSGKNYKAICPFHDDHDPSLSISAEKKIYKCFVCGNGGNVFTFVQNFENISFIEAVGKVAELTGFHLSEQAESFQKPKDPHKEKLYHVLNETIAYSMYQLDTQDASYAKEYLDKRGLDQEIRKTFQIGYIPSGDGLTRFLKAKGYEEKDMVSCNVSRINESGIHDVFSERITFPIHDQNGNPIGFSARSMDPQNPSKYINTNETDIFIKGDIVYNLHRAKSDARREGKIYLCEGVTDVIAFARAGIRNAVCTLGTACTDRQLNLLKRSATKIVFCYDGDRAGQNATYKAGKLARSLGCDVSIISNKTGKDPDEILKANGEEGLQELVKHEISWMEFVISYFKNSTNMDNYLEKKEMVEKVKSEIDALDDEMDRQYFSDQLSQLTGFHVEYRRRQQIPVKKEPVHHLIVPDGTKQAEEMILTMMMLSPSACEKFEEELGYLISSDGQDLAMMVIDDIHTYGKANPNRLIDMSEKQSVKDLISKIMTSDAYSRPYDESIFAGAMRKIKIEVLQDEANQYKEQLTHALNGSSLQLLMSKYNECLQEQRRLMNEEDNARS